MSYHVPPNDFCVGLDTSLNFALEGIASSGRLHVILPACPLKLLKASKVTRRELRRIAPYSLSQIMSIKSSHVAFPWGGVFEVIASHARAFLGDDWWLCHLIQPQAIVPQVGYIS